MIENDELKAESFAMLKYQFFLQREIWDLIDRAGRAFLPDDFRNFLLQLNEDITRELTAVK